MATDGLERRRRTRRTSIAAALLLLAAGLWSAEAGAQERTAEVRTELRCSLTVTPYLVDSASGRRTRATPDRFAMRTLGGPARVSIVGDEWQVRASRVSVEYELLDRTNGAVVLRERVGLACGRPAPETSGPDVIALTPDRVFRGATVTRGPDDRGSCGGQGGPEQWYEVNLERPARFAVRLVSDFDATLYLRAGSREGPEVQCLDQAARLETLELNLEPGRYFLAVDGTGTQGRYRLVSYEDPVDPRAFRRGVVERLESGESIESVLVPTLSRYEASCGGQQAPEHVYAIRVERGAVLHLQSRFDAALYILDARGVELECRRAIGGTIGGRARYLSISRELPPGLYYVVVDGEHPRATQGRYRLRFDAMPR